MQKALYIRFKKLLKIKNFQLFFKKQVFKKKKFLKRKLSLFKTYHHIGGFFKCTIRIPNFIKNLDYQKKNWIDLNKHNFFFKYCNKKHLLLRYFFYKLAKQPQQTLPYINLYSYLIQFITRFGKMSRVKLSLTSVFFTLYKNLKISKTKILLLLFLRLYTKVEIRHIKVRRRVHIVPFLISIERQFFLTLKWLLVAVQENKERCSYEKKFLLEITNILKNKASSIIFLEKNNNLASKNRSNAHYRW